MTLINFYSILSHDIINNNYSKPQEEDVNTTSNFSIVMLTGDRGSFDTNHPHAPTSFPQGYWYGENSIMWFLFRIIFSLSGISSNHTRNVLFVVIGHYGNKTQGRRMRCKWCIKKGVTKINLGLNFYKCIMCLCTDV